MTSDRSFLTDLVFVFRFSEELVQNPPMPTVNVTKLANALNLSEQRVQQLVHEGMPREARGQYDAVKCMLWYIRYLQNVIEKRSVSTLEGELREAMLSVEKYRKTQKQTVIAMGG